MRSLVLLLAVGLLAFLAYRRIGRGSQTPAVPERPPVLLPSLMASDIELPQVSSKLSTFESCVWLAGSCALEVTAAGVGTGQLFLENESGARTELCSIELDDQVELRKIEMEPGPLRPVKLYFNAPKSFRWRKLRLLVDPVDPLDRVQSSETGAQGRLPALERGALAGHDVYVILLDALHATHLGAWGNERPTSPNLDRLAAEGVRFARAYSQTAWTLPSVVTLFTSLEQEVHGVRELGQKLAEARPTLGLTLDAAGYRNVALVQNAVADRNAGWARGVEYYREYKHPLAELDRLLEELVTITGEVPDDDRPLFVYAHLLPPHGPYLYPGDGSTEFDPNYAGPVDGSTAELVKLIQGKLGADHPDVVHLRALYDEYIRFVDRKVGETIERIRAANERPKLFVILSDHGESFLEHGVLGHEKQVYEEFVHVPLILLATDGALPAGLVVESPVSLLDIYPTLIELLGLPEPQTALRGRSLVPACAGTELQERPLFLSARYPKEAKKLHNPQRAVSYAGFKLVHTLHQGTERYELFHIAVDPSETRSVSLESPVRTEAMKELYEAWQANTEEQNNGASVVGADLSEERIRELRALGYFGEEEADD